MNVRDAILAIKAIRIFIVNADQRNGDGDCTVCGEHDLHKHSCETVNRQLNEMLPPLFGSGGPA